MLFLWLRVTLGADVVASKLKKKVLWFSIAGTMISDVVCVYAIIIASLLRGTPQMPEETALFILKIGITGMSTFIVATFILSLLLFKAYGQLSDRREKLDNPAIDTLAVHQGQGQRKFIS